MKLTGLAQNSFSKITHGSIENAILRQGTAEPRPMKSAAVPKAMETRAASAAEGIFPNSLTVIVACSRFFLLDAGSKIG